MILLDSAKPFYKANFHLHTTNSDGRRSPEEAIALYREQGYDVLAITDHWCSRAWNSISTCLAR